MKYPEPKSSPSQDSIFSSSESPWDHVFADIDTVHPLPPASARRQAGRSSGNTPSSTSDTLLGRPARARRQAMTAQEINAFDEMFNMIFNAVSDRRAAPGSSRSLDRHTPSIGPSSSTSPLNDIFRTLRRHSSRVRWTSAADEELDRKKEEMDLCDTDQELLEWAAREVFAVSTKSVDDARKAIEDTTTGIQSSNDHGKDKETSMSTKTPVQALPLQPPTYPFLLAHLMKVFRTTYTNPSLSLCIFTHASRLSIPSYVFGCTAPVYNELIQAKWEGWGDLAGVCAALEEMRLNGVRGDGLTKMIIEKIRREVAEARPVELGGDNGLVGGSDRSNLLARRLWIDLGEAEVVQLLTRIEHLTLKETARKSRSPKRTKKPSIQESWKTEILNPETNNDTWEFDNWSRLKKPKGKMNK
ncbi:hypothetical protein J3A83DRAFT_4358110 [Scleroderma citrinum]